MPAGRIIGTDQALAERRTGRAQVVLRRYPSAGRQPRHVHDHAQLSFLLAGRMREVIGGRTFEPAGPAFCFKPAGADHADDWGERGVLIFSAQFRDDGDAALRDLPRARWQPYDTQHLPALLRRALAADPADDVEDVLSEIVAMVSPLPPSPTAPWLRRVREALDDGEPWRLADAARAAGVHRVHLSRSFVQGFGMTFSDYRHRAMTTRAAQALLADGGDLRAVAQDAGFADQSHMTRALSAAIGATPKRLRRFGLVSAGDPPRVRSDHRPTASR